MALTAGSFIDKQQRYEVTRLIGQGGMASVYEVTDHQTAEKKSVALKLASAEPNVRESAKRRLVTEFKILRKISSSRVIRVLDLGESSNGSPFFTMEIATGEPLAKWLVNRPDRLPAMEIVRLLTEIASSVAEVHESGFVFADLTPANIFVAGENGQYSVKLIDFGLACESVPFEASVDLSKSQHGSLVGTKTHISPEQVRGDPLTVRTDVYAFGIVAYQICTGQLPYQMENPLALIANQAVSRTPSVRAINPDLPRSLELIILVAMEKDPADRFSGMQEIVDCLTKVSEKSWFQRALQRLLGRIQKPAI